MKRKEFLFKSLISGLGLSWGTDIPAKASDRQIEQVGFNHIKIMETKNINIRTAPSSYQRTCQSWLVELLSHF